MSKLKSLISSVFIVGAMAQAALAEDADIQVVDNNVPFIDTGKLSEKFNFLTILCRYSEKDRSPLQHQMMRSYYKPVFSSPSFSALDSSLEEIKKRKPNEYQDWKDAFEEVRERAKKYAFLSSFEGILTFGADPQNWHEEDVQRTKYEYAVSSDGKMISLNTPEENKSLLETFKEGKWDAGGYLRGGSLDKFKNLARAQCGLGL